MVSLLYFFRHPRVLPSVEFNDPLPARTAVKAAADDAPSLPQPLSVQDGHRTTILKRKASGPLDSGRTPAVVSKRWNTLNRPMDPGGPGQRAREIRSLASVAARADDTAGSWASRLNPLRLVKIKKEASSDDENDENDEDDNTLSQIVVARSEYDLRKEAEERRNREIPDSQELQSDAETECNTEWDDQDDGDKQQAPKEEEDDDDDDDSGWYDPALSGKAYPHPGLPQQVQSFKGSTLDASIDQPAADTDAYDSDDSLEEEDEKDGVEENWDWLLEAEPVDTGNGVAPDTRDYYWTVDADERAAYEQGVAAIDDYKSWTADEKRLHRLLSLRGFHPLLPAGWTLDFLGVPMYPSLFAPTQRADAPVTIANLGSQFHATKALRALFDLQSRVSGLRQTGHNTVRIGAIIERELRRYIAWAAADAGLDRCGPLAAMPNIAAKQFVVGPSQYPSPNGRGKKTKKRSLARQVQDYFGDWVARYRAYYAALPEYPVEGGSGRDNSKTRQRLRPPRLLYGFVVVQHAVMLLVVDAASHRSSRHSQPRCLADFNLSLGDRWLDASLSVAIPVHVARAAQLRCREGLMLPATDANDADVDA